MVLTYFLLVSLNSDYLTFLTYLPLTIITLLGSTVFIKNSSAGAASVLFTLCIIEVLNYFYLPESMGYLTLFSVDFLNAAFICVASILVAAEVFEVFKKHVLKTRGVANE